jgi:hypothetical protein
MTGGGADGFDKAGATRERARLQQLLDDYEAGREAQRAAADASGSAREIDVDRAANVRRRIARLDEIIGAQAPAETPKVR